jgi:predicted alpha/beta-fold hydrolase
MLTAAETTDSFAPAWWVPGAHAQTLWGKFARNTPLPPGRLERWETPDDDFLEVFRVAAPPSAPRLLVLHGLEGTVRSHYARGILQRAAAAGWAADLLIFRGCGAELNRRPRFYHSGETSDLQFVAQRIAREFPAAELYIVGYSLGGNVLLKWLGERGALHPPTLRAAAAVSVPFDLEAGARYIHHGFSRIYELHFLRTLKRKALAKLERFPDAYDRRALEAVDSIVDFDDVVTAPLHGFAGAHDYYSRSSAQGFLSSIRLPTALISAYDDPFLPPDILATVARTAAANPALHVAFSPQGGHVGFVGGANPARPKYYSEDRVFNFFDARSSSPGSVLR